jgi:hypothetical protein
MAKTFMQLVQNAIDEIGSITTPSFIIGNTDQNAKQILALSNREAQEFSRLADSFGGWQALRKDYTFPLVNTVETYALPSDYRFMLPNTIWQTAFRWQLLGPLSRQEWNVLEYGLTPAGPRMRFMIENNLIYINPTPSSTLLGNVAYAYISNGITRSAANVVQTEWLADTDTYVLDEQSFILGLKWRFLAAKKLDYVQEKLSYDQHVQQALARNAGSTILPLNANNTRRFLDTNNIPDTGFGT